MATRESTMICAVPNFTSKIPKPKLRALINEMEMVAIKSGSQDGFPRNARIAQTLLIIAWIKRGTRVLKIKETGVPSAKVHGAAQAAANPVTITKGRIHGLARVALVLLG
jgi:hypothetical protein